MPVMRSRWWFNKGLCNIPPTSFCCTVLLATYWRLMAKWFRLDFHVLAAVPVVWTRVQTLRIVPWRAWQTWQACIVLIQVADLAFHALCALRWPTQGRSTSSTALMMLEGSSAEHTAARTLLLHELSRWRGSPRATIRSSRAMHGLRENRGE